MAVTQLLMPGPFWPITTPWRPLTRAYPSAMWAAPCSCTTGMSRMPAGAKMSIASMKAEPMMPKMSVTLLATSVSTKASEGVIFCMPATTGRAAAGAADLVAAAAFRLGEGFLAAVVFLAVAGCLGMVSPGSFCLGSVRRRAGFAAQANIAAEIPRVKQISIIGTQRTNFRNIAIFLAP